MHLCEWYIYLFMYDNKWQINVVVLHMQFLFLNNYVANDNRQKYKCTQKDSCLKPDAPLHIFLHAFKILYILTGYSSSHAQIALYIQQRC